MMAAITTLFRVPVVSALCARFSRNSKAQRDRFRSRIKELEAEREDEQREARGARGVMESLQKDNLQLYEKVRQSWFMCAPNAYAILLHRFKASFPCVHLYVSRVQSQPSGRSPGETLFFALPECLDLSNCLCGWVAFYR